MARADSIIGAGIVWFNERPAVRVALIKTPDCAGVFISLLICALHAGTGCSCSVCGSTDLGGFAVLRAFFSSSACSFFARCSASCCHAHHSYDSHITRLLLAFNDSVGLPGDASCNFEL